MGTKSRYLTKKSTDWIWLMELVTASAVERPCELVKYHAPAPVVTQYHHTKPEYLQKRLYGRVIHAADLWVCGTCHDSIHAWLYYLMGERKKPAYIGRAAKASAQASFEWFNSEVERLGLGA